GGESACRLSRSLLSGSGLMADYFTHFSCLLDVGTPENTARALDLYNQLSEDGASEEPPSDGFLRPSSPSMAAPNSGCATTSPAIPNG
ncbi:hypothetical protein, partial [Xanthomonas euvesicatoria]|uniref:hypothetical protein n=1 Tax=Xanthomonas euvesicatoria TaxID=456327 RepID=UPI0019CF7777